MKTKRQTEIRVETHELTIIRFPSGPKKIFCPACAAPVLHLEVGPAAAILSLTETAVFRVTESGRLHATESNTGSLLLCGNSIAALAEELKNYK